MVLIVGFTAIIFGCAGQKDFRKTAELTADLTNKLKQETETFFNEADNLDQSNESRLRQIRVDTDIIKRDTNVTITAWELASNKHAAEMFSALTKIKAYDIARQFQASGSTNATQDVERVNFNPIQYENLVKRLNDLAKNSSFTENISSFIAYGKAVTDKMNEDKNNAKNQLQDTKTLSDDADKKLNK